MIDNHERANRRFMMLVVLLGILAVTTSLIPFPFHQFNYQFFLLSLCTLVLAPRITVSIPFALGQVTATDTFVFLTMFICGGESAVLLAAADGVCSSFQYTKTKLTTAFNGGMIALAAFCANAVLRFILPDENAFSGAVTLRFVIAIFLAGLIYYIVNTVLVAIRTRFKTGMPIAETWSKRLLWIPATFLAGVSVAAITAKLVIGFGFHAIALTLPIVAVVYTFYRVYCNNLETVAEKAAEAERHVEELNVYIKEQELMRGKVMEAERLSALGEMASGVAHNFNNTLAAITGRAQLAARAKDLPEEARRSLELIIKTANDGANTVRRIQDLARSRNKRNFQLVAVDQLVMDVGEITRPRWKDHAEASNAHITLALEISSKAWIMGDAGELREVLINMIFNSVDAMPNGGRLTLTTREVPEGVEISIADTGVGMSREVRARIFDPFYTTKGARGMGLGLAVSYGIIARHNGNVHVDTVEERGTVFKITLPLAQPSDTTAAEDSLSVPLLSPSSRPAKLPAATEKHKPRILVIEDERHIADVINEVLQDCGCEVTLAASGTEAVEILETQRFDAVFTDIGLPGISGWEVARHIRAHDGELFIAVITGWGDTAAAERQQRALRIQELIAKPFDLDTIIALASRAVAYSDNLKEQRALIAPHIFNSSTSDLDTVH